MVACHLGERAAKPETTDQPTNRHILATVGTFFSRLCGTESGYFNQNVRRVSSCGCGNKSRYFNAKHHLFQTLTRCFHVETQPDLKPAALSQQKTKRVNWVGLFSRFSAELRPSSLVLFLMTCSSADWMFMISEASKCVFKMSLLYYLKPLMCPGALQHFLWTSSNYFLLWDALWRRNLNISEL